VDKYDVEWHAIQRISEEQSSKSDRRQKAVARLHFQPLLPQRVIKTNKQTNPCSIIQTSQFRVGCLWQKTKIFCWYNWNHAS